MTSKSESANDAANYAYLKYELIKTERSTIPAVTKTTTPKDAATAFEANFERAGKPALENRIRYANEVYVAMKGNGKLSATSSSTATSDVGSTDSNCEPVGAGIPAMGKVFDTVTFPLRVKRSDIVNRTIFHNGTTDQAGHPYIAFDILAPAGTQVLALTSGRITVIKMDGSMGGGLSIYNEEKKLHVYYTHMRPDSSLKVGQVITPGTPLGALLSVKEYPKINADHLHIDAGSGDRRLSCSRSNSNGAACNTRVDIGPDLFSAWEKLEK